MRRRRKRELPEPTSVWQTAAFFFLSCAFGAGCAAIALPGGAAVRPSELWIVVGSFGLAACLCLLAHLDVNRGRRSKEFEVEDLPP